MNLVKQIYELNEQFYRHLLIQPQKEERDAYIEQINQLIDRREELISMLAKEINIKELGQAAKQLGEKVIEQNLLIDQLLEKRYDEIEINLKKVREQKKLQRKYVQPTRSLSFDGMFFDKRK